MHDHLTVTVRAEPSALRLCLKGDLDLGSVDVLRRCLAGIDDSVRTVILDLGELDFLDSAGLNLFVLLRRQFGPELRELLIANAHGAALRVLEISGLDQVISVSEGPLEPGIAEPA